MKVQRYSELDWLRVILILAVFLHHVFMPFNGDKWHVMNTQSSKLLDDIMVYFEQLRLPTLFFIAGAGSLLLLKKTKTRTFIISKFHRLFIPLIVGMMLIVPPQNYYENVNEYTGIIDAYKHLFFSFDANHLWFIEFLIVFMLLAIPAKSALNSQAGCIVINKLEQLVVSSKHGLFSLVLIISLFRCSLKLLMPSEDNGVDNLSVSIFFLLFFMAGMSFMSKPKIWEQLSINRSVNLKWFIFSSIVFYSYYFMPDMSDYVPLVIRWQLWWLVCTLVSWSGLLAMIGYASALCTKTPTWLHTANELIYPFYILHQTIIVALAFYIVQWDKGIAIKSITLLLSTFLVCSFLCYFFVKPVSFFRYLFGLKPQNASIKN
ncbi:acyltransferase family protein [Agarilytica rhodophyticola]|uniref:acyltransferase family protein n=1 Tax=Agarilytica rhodophyticola TaxID=1737490 RepID=UPI000B347B5A|nr:acyltransferase family protein [Agarilytica rhodophyticola]